VSRLLLISVLQINGTAYSFNCPHTRRRPVVEVWSGNWPPSADFVWCVRSNTVAGIPIYTELITGKGFCHGSGCMIHRGRLTGSLMNEDHSVGPANGLPHGILVLNAQWRGRCTLSGETPVDPPLVGGGPLVGRVGGSLNAELICRQSGRAGSRVISFILTRSE